MFKRKIIEETEQPDKRSKHDISESDSLSETWRTWKDNLTRLIAYRDAHDGDCNVPQTWKDDPQLGIWVKNQKQHLRKYKADPATSSLNTERIAILQKIGAITSWSNATQYAFKEKLKCLIKYRDAHDGDCNVPQIWKYDQKLANWVKLQKTEFYKYKNDPKTSKLTPERISLLEEAGAIKSWLLKRRLLSRTNRKWEENLTRLITYRDANDGDCNVPQSYKKDPQLGIWVMTQKKNLRKYKANPVTSRLSADQVAKLQEIGAITSWSRTAHRRWEDNLMRLIAYRDKHNGCCNVPRKWEKDHKLANWVKFHKTEFRKYKEDPATSQLNPKRISTLKEIGAIKSWFPSKKSEKEEICDKTEKESDDETEEESEEETEDESEETSEIETEEESDEEANLEEKIVFLKNDIKKILEESKSIPVITSL